MMLRRLLRRALLFTQSDVQRPYLVRPSIFLATCLGENSIYLFTFIIQLLYQLSNVQIIVLDIAGK